MPRRLVLCLAVGLPLAGTAHADPRQLSAVAQAVEGAESGWGSNPRMWRPDAAGPQGPMQITAAAAADVGGGDRFDLEQNRALGRAYLEHMYWRFGSWADAVAAYNWGPGRMDDWIRSGRPAAGLPPAVDRYRDRVLYGASVPAGARLTGFRGLRLPRLRGVAHAQPVRSGPPNPKADRMVAGLFSEVMAQSATR